MDYERENGGLRNAWMNNFLIAVNVIVFAAGMAGTGRIWDRDFMVRAGALYAPLLLKGQGFYRLVTSVFLHADVTHLFNNMIVLFAGGMIAEKNLGHIRYGILYILSGIGGNLVSIAADFCTGQYGYSIGASGAVFGVIGSLLYMILREAISMKRVSFQEGSGERNVWKSLLIRAGLMTAYLLYSGWSNPVVNQAAHVGGLIVGFVLTIVLIPQGQSDLSDLLQ